jgi:hypothetical protein
MKYLGKGLTVILLWGCLAMPPGSLASEPPPTDHCEEAVTLLKEQNSKLSGDLRRIQREIAALRADLDKPGLEDIFSGIGYILGLFGMAAFVASRRRKE